jgi:predicted AAA+ superfamily ATPase
LWKCRGVELNNIFVEGIQRAGKSTLLNRLKKNMPAYKVYKEGDIIKRERIDE